MTTNLNAGQELTAALDAYRHDFEQRIRTPKNADAETAAALLAEARDIVGNSGLGTALAPTLLEHIKYWPMLSQKKDFHLYVGFPATDILAKQDDSDRRAKITGVLFRYETILYGVRFVNYNFQHYVDDSLGKYGGKIDFVVGQETVLGLDISQGRNEFATWRWHDVYAFKAGEWTKHLLEIATHITYSSKYISTAVDSDTIKRAQNVRL